MMHLKAHFSSSHLGKADSAQQPKLVQGSLLVYASIPQAQSFDSITAEINQLVSDTLNEHRKIQNLVLAVDLICVPDTIADGESQQLAGELLGFIDRQFPNIRDRFVGITGDESKLPLQGLLISGALAFEEIDNQHLFVME
ncbi:MAG: hypothetical protein AB1649_33055 [Chloroflexota bacterium]